MSPQRGLGEAGPAFRDPGKGLGGAARGAWYVYVYVYLHTYIYIYMLSAEKNSQRVFWEFYLGRCFQSLFTYVSEFCLAGMHSFI